MMKIDRRFIPFCCSNEHLRWLQTDKKLPGKNTFLKDAHLAHHAEGVFDPNPMIKQMVTIFGYPRACRFRKHQFENRSWLLPLPTFFKA
jgi:hypothetical protein